MVALRTKYHFFTMLNSEDERALFYRCLFSHTNSKNRSEPSFRPFYRTYSTTELLLYYHNTNLLRLIDIDDLDNIPLLLASCTLILQHI